MTNFVLLDTWYLSEIYLKFHPYRGLWARNVLMYLKVCHNIIKVTVLYSRVSQALNTKGYTKGLRNKTLKPNIMCYCYKFNSPSQIFITGCSPRKVNYYILKHGYINVGYHVKMKGNVVIS